MSLHSEILEQPGCLQGLVRTQRKTAEKIARTIKAKDIRLVYVAARGTSENAGRYATYLWGVMNGFPVALAAPSLFTYYNHPPHLDGAFVVGISQSGRSPDIVSVLTEAKRQGCLTLAITNAVDSPLANAADFVLHIQAGEENAVAATKTYTAQLMAVAMLSAAISGDDTQWQELLKLPEWVDLALTQDSLLGMKVQRYRSISSCVVLGRGFNYATAYEWALKLNELAYVVAQPYSSADFMHGPIAMVDSGFPILAVIPGGAVYASMIDVLKKLRHGRAAELVVISDLNGALELGQTSLPLPQGIPEWLSPIVSIVPAQLFCYHLARAKGCNTESPRGIHKVTETR
jgi:glucosamine--fructose-6-phosphate aminotransferase (isomerizing)